MNQKELHGAEKQTEPQCDDKAYILKHVHLTQWEEVKWRREQEFKIFTWSNTMLLALIGALLVTKQTETVIWETYGIGGRVVAALTVILLVIYSVKWQNRQRRLGYRNARVIVKISKCLNCFSEGYFDLKDNSSLFPSEWASWGKLDISSPARILRANLISATTLLGILALIMIWLP